MLFSGCWAVRAAPEVWAWVRSNQERWFWAPKVSRSSEAQIFRGGAKFCDFFKKVVADVEEEAEAGGEVVDLEAAVEAPADVLEAVAEGEGEFLDSVGACLADVVAADADGVPAGEVVGGVLDGVDDEAHGGPRGEDVLVLGDIFLEDVVLDGAAELFLGDALFFGGDDVHGPDDGGGGVDGHGGGDLIEGDAIEENLHVGEGGDGDAALAELALGGAVVGVVAVEGGHIEGGAEAGLAVLEEVLEAGVGLLGGAVAGEHAHGPEAAAVAGGMDATGVGELAGESDVLKVGGVVEAGGGVDGIHGDIGGSGEEGVADGLGGSALPPLGLGVANLVHIVR